MKLARFAGVVAAVVLIVGSEAWAACAWVMWQETAIMELSKEGDIRRTGGWDMQSAHPTYSQCVQAAQKLALDARADTAVMVAFGTSGKLVRAGEQGIYMLKPVSPSPPRSGGNGGTLTFQCFPDTADPRPRTKE